MEKSPFKTTKNSVAIKSDVDEGRYLWLTINFLLGKVKLAQDCINIHEYMYFSGRLNNNFENTVTSLDLNDSSLQITFMPTGDEQNQEFVTDRIVMGQSVKLYSRRYT